MKQLSLDEIDANFHVPKTVTDTDITWRDVRQAPFAVYGLYDYKNTVPFRRMPEETAAAVSAGVAELSYNTAGGRVRFSTDSDLIAIHATMNRIGKMPHIPLTGSAGFDLYVDGPATGTSRYFRTFMPPFDIVDGYEAAVCFPSRKLRYLTVNFPLYAGVDTLLIGTRDNATVGEGLRYRNSAPIVYYGSSITQGGCASRPGNCYQNIVARRTGLDYVNLGFSGSGKAEDAMIDYLASLGMCAFVSDYDHNAPNPQHLRNTHCKLYRAIRAAHPDVPYLMISRIDFDSAYTENLARRDVILDTYRYAREQGDRNVYYIDGASVFRGLDEDSCTVDGTHPNDHGFFLYADALCAELKRAFTEQAFL